MEHRSTLSNLRNSGYPLRGDSIRLFKVIVVFGNWPTGPKDFEGMVLRIRDIDQAFASTSRAYMQFRGSFWTVPRPVNLGENLEFWDLNLKNPWHLWNAMSLMLRAKWLYAHSLLNLNSRFLRLLLKALPHKNLALDFHGVLPEEFAFDDQPEVAEHFEHLEREMMARASVYVVVSPQMRQHLESKHSQVIAEQVKEWILIPTAATTEIPTQIPPQNQDSNPAILYSGGLQKWQNVPEVLTLMQRLSVSKYPCSFFTYDLRGLAKLMESFPDLEKVLRIDHLSPEELPSEYARHDFGVVLRDAVLVNRVACPTKIMDYLAWGLVPIVKSKDIGDFVKWGVPMIGTEEITRLSAEEIHNLKLAARRAFDTIQGIREIGLQLLRALQ